MLQPAEPFGPVAESQFQPVISTSPLNCVPCVTRKLIRRATTDAKAPSTATVRAKSGAPSTRGLTYGEAATAGAAFGVKLIPSYGNSRDEVFDLADAGHGFGISIDCSVTVHTARATGGFTGDHTVYDHDVRHCPAGGTCKCEKESAARVHNEYLIEDPGNSSQGYLWWSADLVYRAAEARTRDRNGISHGINLLVGPDTEGALVKAVLGATLREQPDRTAKAMGKLVVGRTYKGRRTRTGTNWKRPNGSIANGWREIELQGANGWVEGRAAVLV
jgi:hypothetical protein